MSYAVHVTRSKNWYNCTNLITNEEWKGILSTTDYFELYDPADVDDPELGVCYREKDCELDHCFYFDGKRGIITIRSGHYEQPLRTAIKVAEMLGAVVQGDNLEYYPTVESRLDPSWLRPVLNRKLD